jgi:hypothetical protein
MRAQRIILFGKAGVVRSLVSPSVEGMLHTCIYSMRDITVGQASGCLSSGISSYGYKASIHACLFSLCSNTVKIQKDTGTIL